MNDLATIAPNQMAEVQRTMIDHPEIDTMADPERAEVIDITARRLNRGGEKPWGRKARNNDPNNPNLNTDAMCFLRPDGNFEIYDVISGIDGSATWDNHGVYNPGENGYWWPPNEVDDSGNGGEVPGSNYVTQDQLALVQSQVDTHTLQITANAEAIAALKAQILHTHGPVDLPVILDGFSLRARGDIDVAVKPGEATPPEASGSNPPTLLDIAVLRKLLDRIRPE